MFHYLLIHIYFDFHGISKTNPGAVAIILLGGGGERGPRGSRGGGAKSENSPNCKFFVYFTFHAICNTLF